MSASTRRLRIRSWYFLALRRGFSSGLVCMSATGLLVALHVAKLTAFQAVTSLRGRKTRQEDVPHVRLGEVQVGNNALQLYRDGHTLYDAMLTAIDGARESIYLEASIWLDDEVGRAFKRHLVKKAAEGIAVYVMCAGSGKSIAPRAFRSSPTNVHILGQRLFPRPWYVLDPRRYALDHRKLLVVDGVVGFIGGYNLGSRYATGWRDTHLRIRGQAAAELAHAFIDYWNQYSVPRERITRRYPRQFDPLIVVRANDALRLTFPIRDMYIEAIGRAEQTILLTNASFVPDRSVLDALKAAVERGVDVRVLVPWPSRHSITNRVACGAFTQCLQVGIRLFGYRPAILRAKTCMIDGQWSTIGSAHLDLLSSVVNYECNVEIYDASIASQMQELFACDTAGAVELSLARWMNRPWYIKLSERLVAPLRFLL
jgi:cardiolipin synthase